MGIKSSFIFFFLGIFFGFAQKDSIPNPYVKSYDDKVTASIYYFDISNNFDVIFFADGKDQYVNLEPNRREQIGANLSYSFIDLSYGFSPDFFDVNKDNSDSKLFSLNTRIYLKKWMQSVVFINQKGFYIGGEDINLQFPRLRTTKIGGSTSYVFNDNFSFKTLANQKEWQTKSAGSFIPNFSLYYTNIDLNDNNSNNTSDIFLFSLAPSYYYNLVISHKLLLSAGFTAGIGINSLDEDVSGIYELGSSLKIGYNTDSFFTFVDYNYTNFIQSASTKIRLNDDVLMFKVTLGYRFNPPKKVKKMLSKIKI
jgi:Domain of unknown function (DUF4421)